MTIPPSAPETKIYRPDRAKQYRRGIGLLAGGLLFLGASYGVVAKWIHGGGSMDLLTVFILAGGPLFLTGALAAFAHAIRGLPRLTITPGDIKFETLFGMQWAKWTSLGPFVIVSYTTGRSKRRTSYATAPITGKDVNAALRGKKYFRVADSFPGDLKAIAAELNAQRLKANPQPALENAHHDAPANSVGLANFKRPWLTHAILAALALVFAGEYIFAVAPAVDLSPSIKTLVALGGLTRGTVFGLGEWYRVFTAPLLHAGLFHIFMNGVALFFAGVLLERMIGRLWFFAFFTLGAVGGSLMSLALNQAGMISIGASGAIMGLFAALFILTFHLPDSPTRGHIHAASLRVLIPSMLPLAIGGIHIDVSAHLGGALADGLLAFILLKTWPDTSRLPPFRALAGIIAMAGFILFVVGFIEVAGHYSFYKNMPRLIPPEVSLDETKLKTEDAATLVEIYPGDPRSHWLLARKLKTGHDLPGAERELKTALNEIVSLKRLFGGRTENLIRGDLALVLSSENKQDEARAVADPFCRKTPADPVEENLSKALHFYHVCS